MSIVAFDIAGKPYSQPRIKTMRTPLQYENLFSEGFATVQPPTRTQLDVARQAVSDECQAISDKVQRLNTVAAAIAGAQILSLLLIVFSLVNLLWQGTVLTFWGHFISLLTPSTLLLAQMGIKAFDRSLTANLERRQATLQGLLPLDPEQAPEACVAYAALGEEDELIRAYQRQISAQGRLPVMKEYTCAAAWVKNQRAQQARDAEIRAAKAAFQQWAKPV